MFLFPKNLRHTEYERFTTTLLTLWQTHIYVNFQLCVFMSYKCRLFLNLSCTDEMQRCTEFFQPNSYTQPCALTKVHRSRFDESKGTCFAQAFGRWWHFLVLTSVPVPLASALQHQFSQRDFLKKKTSQKDKKQLSSFQGFHGDFL